MQQSFRKSLSPRRTGTLSPRASPRRLKPLQEENIVGHIRALQKDAGDSADAYLAALAAQERASDVLAASYRMRAAPASPRGRGGSQLSSAAGSDAGYGGAQAAQKPALSARPQLDKDTKGFIQQASNAMNSRFSDMFKAFQYVDLDKSGSLDAKEIRRALDMWNVPMDEEKLQKLVAACDHDGDGQVDYKEFVDMLARDTVAPAAMGKRDMQSLEAMGVDAQEMLNLQLGHGKEKAYKISINATDDDAPPGSGGRGRGGSPRAPAPKPKPQKSKAQMEKETKMFIDQASNAMNSRFTDMFKAFQYVDLDKSGTLNKKELRRALDFWNVPLDEEMLEQLISACDHDGDGEVDYKEFVDHLARDTVTVAAMGKRDMQSLEAMGVDAQEMLNLQLGHGKEKAYKISINDGMDDTAFAVQMSDEDRLKQASNAMNSRFTDMFKAFQYVDLDGSGTVDEKELLHALDLWNVPIDKASVKKLIAKCDHDGDGGIDYKEFVDHLARDTVAPAAMGKRDMQSKQAMGVDAQEMLNLQLGHGKEKSYKISIND
jgi:Ca2+-binding EF-hand superfamily protein